MLFWFQKKLRKNTKKIKLKTKIKVNKKILKNKNIKVYML